MLCSEASLVNHGERRFRAVTLRCNCWSCGLCEPKRIARLVRDVADGLPEKFMTLTTRAVEDGDEVAEARRQTDAFAALMRAIRKRYPGLKIAYFVVREATKRGWPHMHVALRSPFIDVDWLRTQWDDLTGSNGVDIRKIRDTHAAAKYLAKYIGKSPHRFGSTKRYWHSRHWHDVCPPAPPVDTTWDSRWFIVREHICKLRETYCMRKWVVPFTGSFNFFEAHAPP